MKIQCGICIDEECDSEDYFVVTQCGHTWHYRCIQRWLDQNRNCPVCKKLIKPGSLVKIFGDHGALQPPSIPSSSSTVGDEEEEEISILGLLEYSDEILGLTNGAAKESTRKLLLKKVKGLAAKVNSHGDIEEDVKTLIISSMAALEKLLEGYISRMLKKLEETREDDSRLSSELEDVKKVKQQQELHFAAREKELSGLHHTEKQRAASLEAQCGKEIEAAQKMKAERDKLHLELVSLRSLKVTFDNLYKENLGRKENLESKDAEVKRLKEDNERFKNTLARQADALRGKERKIERLQDEIEELSGRLERMTSEQSTYATSSTPPSALSFDDEYTGLHEDEFEGSECFKENVDPQSSSIPEKMMPWKRQRPQAFINVPPPKPTKLLRTETNVGPLKLKQGKLVGPVVVGNRQRANFT